ncbi:bifunctional 2-polyprenyl-6-hydroxyphenol methylase/3-demethylubiquinol 3-O-methyltransferase UbiG [Geobacter sp. SVR]|uniref:class I SAM-dependent methyltransferase n=1 Tax=Geobacter sp. SVR TaxID=2495594 RepID=UPI00143EFD8C|nr:class I SAM-dependent methyltransferase [Geobacter sp. SVR]BCS53656.1 SAM-dependent methyltransferase [Geobacter sp. SVR]GCF84147.1 SAM-dependent methyltransferase [Geobacter sp. SVR]
MEEDRLKWNLRFGSEEAFLGVRPSPFLAREMERIKALAPGRRALDIACGEGRNAIFLARHGFEVTGLDISDVGLAKADRWATEAGVTVDFRWADLEDYCIDEEYDLIINFNFLLRDLIPQAFAALAPGGLLIVDTILESPETSGTHTAEYLLRYGELGKMFQALPGEVLFQEEVREVAEGEMPTARVLFRKRES